MKRLLLIAALVLLVCPVAPLASPATVESVQDFPMPRPLSQPLPGLAQRLKTLEGRPDTPENLLARGILQALSRRYDEAVPSLTLARERLPALAGWAAFHLGYVRFRQGNFQAALTQLEAIPSEDGALGSEALLLSAYCLEGLEGSASVRALDAYRRFLAIASHPFRAVALWRAAVLAAAQGDYPEAERCLKELFTAQPWTASAAKAEPLARELARAGRIRFDPDSADALRQRIEVLLNKNQTSQATPLLSRYEQAPGADPARALYLKAKALYARRDTETSTQLFEDAARLSRDPLLSAWAVYHQARGYWRFSGPDDAARMDELLTKCLETAARLPDGADLLEAARRLLMLSRLERARFRDALPVAAQLAASGPESTEAREQAVWLSGLMRFALDDFTGARADLAAFLARFPRSDLAPGAHYWTARAAEASGDDATARRELETTVSGWPNGYYGMLAGRRLTALKARAGVGVTGAPAAIGDGSSSTVTTGPSRTVGTGGPASQVVQPEAVGQSSQAISGVVPESVSTAASGAGGPDNAANATATGNPSPAQAAFPGTAAPDSIGSPSGKTASGEPDTPAPSTETADQDESNAPGVNAGPAAAGPASGQSPDRPVCPPQTDPPLPAEARPAVERADVLTAGLLPELAERELAALSVRMPRDPAVTLRYARLATGLGAHPNAVRAVYRAFGACLAKGSRDDLLPLRDIVYPGGRLDLIAQNLTGTDVDPDLIRGLIRQESFFDPDAVSGAGALGLMQMMPATARSQAEKYGEKGFKTESLKDPAVNVRFGVRYFLERYREYGGNVALTLASYNAGRVKIGVWKEFLGGLDPELFVEFIPYTETREYVKRILNNQAMYALLYRS